MCDRIIGRYYWVAGPVIGRYLLADEFEELDEYPPHEDLLIRARSV